MSRLYQLLRNGELESYRDGRSRRIVVKSIQDRVNRLARAEKRWTQINPKPPPRNKRQPKAA
jgi:hypothetical protein